MTPVRLAGDVFEPSVASQCHRMKAAITNGVPEQPVVTDAATLIMTIGHSIHSTVTGTPPLARHAGLTWILTWTMTWRHGGQSITLQLASASIHRVTNNTQGGGKKRKEGKERGGKKRKEMSVFCNWTVCLELSTCECRMQWYGSSQCLLCPPLPPVPRFPVHPLPLCLLVQYSR